jgi:hypothetical protein
VVAGRPGQTDADRHHARPWRGRGHRVRAGQPTVAVAYPKTVQLWNLANPAAPHQIATIPVAANVPTMATCENCSGQDQVALSPDGRTLAMTAAGHAVSL